MVDDTPSDGPPADPDTPSAETAWTVLAYLITGPLIYGGAGWLLDRWLGTNWIVAVGLFIGMALSIYVIVLRYVAPRTPEARQTDERDQGG